jgi:hypothetical protein
LLGNVVSVSWRYPWAVERPTPQQPTAAQISSIAPRSEYRPFIAKNAEKIGSFRLVGREMKMRSGLDRLPKVLAETEDFFRFERMCRKAGGIWRFRPVDVDCCVTLRLRIFIRALIPPWTQHPQSRPFRQLLLAKGLIGMVGLALAACGPAELPESSREGVRESGGNTDLRLPGQWGSRPAENLRWWDAPETRYPNSGYYTSEER